MTLFNKKEIVTIFNSEFFTHAFLKAVVFNVFTIILISTLSTNQDIILFTAIATIIAYIYGIFYIFITPFRKQLNHYDLYKMDHETFKHQFLSYLKLFVLIYFLCSIIPHTLLSKLGTLINETTDPSARYLIPNNAIINLFSIIRNAIWSILVITIFTHNFNNFKKQAHITITPILIFITILFSIFSFATSYLQCFENIIPDIGLKDTVNNVIQHDGEQISTESYHLYTGSFKNEDTTYIYSPNLIYTVNKDSNTLYRYFGDSLEKSEVLLDFSKNPNTEFQLSQIDILYKTDQYLYFYYPSKNSQTVVKENVEGLYSIDLNTLKLTKELNAVLDYGFNGSKQSPTFDYLNKAEKENTMIKSNIFVTIDQIYSISKFDFQTKKSSMHNAFILKNDYDYTIQKYKEDIFVSTYDKTNNTTHFYKNGNNFYSHYFTDVDFWAITDDSIIIISGPKIYRVFIDERDDTVIKSSDIYAEKIVNRLFVDPDINYYIPVVSEIYSNNFMINPHTLENELLNSFQSSKKYNTPFDFTTNPTAIYRYTENTNLVHNPLERTVYFVNKEDYQIIDTYKYNDGFISFDIENMPYIVYDNQITKLHLKNN